MQRLRHSMGRSHAFERFLTLSTIYITALLPFLHPILTEIISLDHSICPLKRHPPLILVSLQYTYHEFALRQDLSNLADSSFESKATNRNHYMKSRIEGSRDRDSHSGSMAPASLGSIVESTEEHTWEPSTSYFLVSCHLWTDYIIPCLWFILPDSDQNRVDWRKISYSSNHQDYAIYQASLETFRRWTREYARNVYRHEETIRESYPAILSGGYKFHTHTTQ